MATEQKKPQKSGKSKLGKAEGKPKAGAAEEAPQADAATGAGNLPLFYQDPQPLHAERHGAMRLRPPKNMSFAGAANSILLLASEFPQAASFYPIVFGGPEADLLPYAVTGHTKGENAFIDADGAWRPNTYIPAYVRRYPFIFVESSGTDTLMLGADFASAMLGEEEGEPLYVDGKPSATTDRALRFCVNYQRELERTKAHVRQIAEAGLLVDRNADVTLPDGKMSKIVGFKTVDEQKLNALDDETFLSLRKTGALVLIFCHLWSTRAWNNILDGSSA